MLDTSVCIELLRAGSRRAMSRFKKLEPDAIAISSITLAELRYGAARSARLAHHELLIAQFCAPLAILPFDSIAAECYGPMRAALEQTGRGIGPLDTLIASHALSRDLTLVSANIREFSRIDRLRVENWLDT